MTKGANGLVGTDRIDEEHLFVRSPWWGSHNCTPRRVGVLCDLHADRSGEHPLPFGLRLVLPPMSVSAFARGDEKRAFDSWISPLKPRGLATSEVL